MLTKSESDIIAYLKDFDSEIKNLKLELMRLCWYMRGGLTYQESLNLGPGDREIANTLIKENLETTKKTGRDFF